MQYWLFKTEPDAFSIDDVASVPNQTEHGTAFTFIRPVIFYEMK